MTMTATARAIDGSLRHEIDVNGRHTITTDEPAKLGGSDTAPTPHELLPAMLASCVSTMITLYARTRDWELQDLRVDVTYDPDSTPRNVELTVHLPDGLTPDQVKRLRASRRHLSGQASVRDRIHIRPTDRARPPNHPAVELARSAVAAPRVERNL